MCALKVTTAQAESALNHIAATELPDEDDGDAVDDEIIAEMEALVGLDVNPSLLDYACHAVDLRQCTQLQLEDVGWPADEPLQALSADDFKMTEARARLVLQDSVDQLKSNFASECMG